MHTIPEGSLGSKFSCFTLVSSCFYSGCYGYVIVCWHLYSNSITYMKYHSIVQYSLLNEKILHGPAPSV